MSKLAPCTAVEDIKSHIATKIRNVNPSNIFLFKLKPTEDVPSFKTLLPTEYFIAFKSFRPKNTLVTDFTSSAWVKNKSRNVSLAKN